MTLKPIFLIDKIKLIPIKHGLVSKREARISLCFLLVHIPGTRLYCLDQASAKFERHGNEEEYIVQHYSDPEAPRPFMCFDCAANELMLRAVERYNNGDNIMIRACEMTSTGYSVSDVLQNRLNKHIRKHSGDYLYKAIAAAITESANTSTR